MQPKAQIKRLICTCCDIPDFVIYFVVSVSHNTVIHNRYTIPLAYAAIVENEMQNMSSLKLG